MRRNLLLISNREMNAGHSPSLRKNDSFKLVCALTHQQQDDSSSLEMKAGSPWTCDLWVWYSTDFEFARDLGSLPIFLCVESLHLQFTMCQQDF